MSKTPRTDAQKSMSPEKQRIAIAKACGWHHKKGGWENIYLLIVNAKYIPDYLNDLNAMYEAVWYRRHDREFVQEYRNQIHKVVGASEWATSAFENATAAQRAEAFLRAMNLWEGKQ